MSGNWAGWRDPQTVPVTIARFDCQTCGLPIEARKIADLEWEWLPHYYCDKPVVSLDVHEPAWAVKVSVP